MRKRSGNADPILDRMFGCLNRAQGYTNIVCRVNYYRLFVPRLVLAVDHTRCELPEAKASASGRCPARPVQSLPNNLGVRSRWVFALALTLS